MLQTLLGRKKYEEAMSYEQPHIAWLSVETGPNGQRYSQNFLKLKVVFLLPALSYLDN